MRKHGSKRGLNMDNKEIEIIKSMVIHGCCKVCFVNGYDSTVLNKFTSEINQLFDNFIENKITAIESKGEKITQCEMIEDYL